MNILPFIFIIIFMVIWIIISLHLRKMAKISSSNSDVYENKAFIECALFTSGEIGLVRMRSCLGIVRVDNGFLLTMPIIFLGGCRFIDDKKIYKFTKSKTLFGFTEVKFINDGDEITLFGRSAKLFLKYYKVSQ